MSEETLFEQEETILRRAEEILRDRPGDNPNLPVEFENLLTGYKKIYKQLRRLIKINDKQARKLNEANELLTQLSTVDGLTGINNRRYFDERLEMEWRRACRHRSPVSLLLVDIDFFKKVNDTYGHQAGDECLKAIAQSMKSFFRRSTDLVARYGGEEFTVLLPDITKASACSLADSLRGKMEALEICCEGLRIRTTISIGVSTHIPEFPEGWERILSEADGALYRAKQNGRNRVCSL